MTPLTRKQRTALPSGLSLSDHDLLLEIFAILGLYHLVHPDGDQKNVDGLRQFADCQTNMIAQADLAEAFFRKLGDDESKKECIFEALSKYANHFSGMNLSNLRSREEILRGWENDVDLQRFCVELEADVPEAYRINMLGYALNVDATIFRDTGGAFANWTVDYDHPVFDNADAGKPKDQVKIWKRRPALKKEASELSRAYTAKRLLEHTSEQFRNTAFENNLRPWNDVADQVSALLPRIVATVEQKDGPDVELGSLLLEVLAWLIVTFREGRSIAVYVRRRQMKAVETDSVPLHKPTVNGSMDNHTGMCTPSASDEEQADDAEKTYRAENFVVVAVPEKNGSGFALRDTWTQDVDNTVMGAMEIISYYDIDQQGTGLGSSNSEEFKSALLCTDLLLLILPTCVAHPPHTGLVVGKNNPQWHLYKEVSPKHKELSVSRTSFQALTLGKYDANLKQASINDMVVYGMGLANEHDHWDTREYDFPQTGKCMALRKEPIDAAPRHFVMATPAKLRAVSSKVMKLQKQADKTGAIVGGYGIRIRNIILNALTRHEGDRIAAIKKPFSRLNEYRSVMPMNDIFSNFSQ